jgi:hypothetical protein
MKERSGTVNQHIHDYAVAIYTWWHTETEPGVTQEEE